VIRPPSRRLHRPTIRHWIDAERGAHTARAAQAGFSIQPSR
jgi:hypothetical protein